MYKDERETSDKYANKQLSKKKKNFNATCCVKSVTDFVAKNTAIECKIWSQGQLSRFLKSFYTRAGESGRIPYKQGWFEQPSKISSSNQLSHQFPTY